MEPPRKTGFWCINAVDFTGTPHHMNLDLLPLNAFALESCAAAAVHSGIVHTLTLKLALDPVPVGEEQMFGIATVGRFTHPHASVLRAGVVPAVEGGATTITF